MPKDHSWEIEREIKVERIGKLIKENADIDIQILKNEFWKLV
jgi:hypothetical protein